MNIEHLLNSLSITAYECLYTLIVILAVFIIANTIRYAYNKKPFFYTDDYAIGMIIGIIAYFFVMTTLRFFNIFISNQTGIVFFLVPTYLFKATHQWPVLKHRLVCTGVMTILLALIHTAVFYE